ncbi:acyl transferase domain-containing protein [Lentinula aff. detonsa]|uniref:6-methylsalicylic acid synthase n=1 Tax=Lentinula aff. detonsa TaxID=2804958 RepID=A0AA38KE48_9AGAR|nr:acyl transferase domain-containing protein [Lentinula aff. detonsa]
MRNSSYSTAPSSPDGQRHYEDVAIVGILVTVSCRTAGGNDSPEKLWQFLLNKKDASGEVPRWRWEPWLRRDVRNAKEVEKTISTGYFIQDLENFDASFFGISPKEAEQMDPHQRLALELSWEALENAGIDPKSLAGSDTAVFMGVDSDDYSRLLLEDLANIEAWMGIGTAAHGIPNRVSYHLDLMGPSTAVDCACASSLTAVHMGCRAITNGESKVAIVGGVNVLLAPALTRMLGKAGALSPEGICRSFDDDANGYARGEGGAIVILKSVASAIADGDNILAIVKGSAIAQDGKTNGIMAPNAKAQELVARQALARAGVDPVTVSFVEAHATSTPLGDPTEISAIQAVYGAGAGRSADQPTMIGSIKPNVGHLEAAAGIIGLVKAVLSVNKGQLAPQTRLNKLNSRIDWENSGLQVVQEVTSWPNESGPRRAAICSYGYGGTVSHAVIEEFVGSTFEALLDFKPQTAGAIVLVISAQQEKRLVQHAKALADWLTSPIGQSQDLSAIANTLAQRRAHHDYRAAFVVKSHSEAIEALNKFAADNQDDADLIASGRVLGLGNGIGLARHAVWVFSGHGAQWKDMGKELITHPVFRRVVDLLEPIYQKEAGFSLVHALEQGDFDTSDRVQSVTYGIQVGLLHVLQSMGLEPQAVIGHSVGEIAASVAAGCLTPEEGALVVIRRAKLYAQVQGLGGMALVNLPFAQVTQELSGRKDLVAAIDSSPTTCVVSGEETAVAKYVEGLKAAGIKTFRVKTDIAFHSPMLDQLSSPLKEALTGSIHPTPAKIRLYSTSNSDMRTNVARDATYWVHNMVSPVHLKSAVEAATEDGYRVFIEVSSHPIVLHSIIETLVSQNIDENEFATFSTMKRDTSAIQSISKVVAQSYTKGAPINFEVLLGPKQLWSKIVPGTPWVHKPYWKQVESGPLGEGITHDVEKHTLLGQQVQVAGSDTIVYTTKLDDKTKPFPGTHPLDGTEIIPAAVYINTFHYATGGTELSHISLRVPVSMSPETRNVQIIIQGDTISVASSAISDADKQTWVSHSSAKWSNVHRFTPNNELFDVDSIKKRIGTRLPNSFSVDYLTKIGVAGIAFPWQVIEHYGNEKEMIAKVDMDPAVEKLPWDERSWAPILDAATSIGSTIYFNDPKLRIVSQIDTVSLYATGPIPKIGYLFVEEAADAKGPASHVSVLDEQGVLLAKFTSMRFSEVEGASGSGGGLDSLVHHISWIPPKFSEKPRALDQVVLVSTNPEVLETYAKQLEPQTKRLFKFSSVEQLENPEILSALSDKGSAVVYIPGTVQSLEEVPASSKEFIWNTTCIAKILVEKSLASTCKLFVITDRAYAGETITGLAHSALYGLGRIIAAEHPDIWGGLIDNESPTVFPLLAAKYVLNQDIIRVVDGMPRCAMMRPLPRDQRYTSETTKTLLPKPEGTYVITGGLGDLGLDTISFLVEKGARRIVTVSRSGLPPRSTWPDRAASDAKFAAMVQRIQEFESLGATIYAVSLDISAPDASDKLLSAIDSLSLPQVLGVIHASGVLEDSLLLETTRDSFGRVLAPKIDGAITLHKAFPPGTVDFFVLYSSIGQLVGTAGQASYGSGNAFLDGLAMYRRAHGDNAVAFQWTAWRGKGMATSTDFLTLELKSKGITDISSEEAFRAWEHVGKYNVESAVVTRCLVLDEGEAVSVPMLEQVVVRRSRATNGVAPAEEGSNGASSDARPTTPAELEKWLNVKIRECIGAVLMIPDIEEIDPLVPLGELGVDSVMTVALRQKLQSALKVKVPPTLTWNHPTVNHLVPWFIAKFKEESG